MFERSTYNFCTNQVQIKVLGLRFVFFFKNLQTAKPIEKYFACVFPAVKSPWNWRDTKTLHSHKAWSQQQKLSYSHVFEGNFHNLSYITNRLNAPKYNFL